MESEQSMQFMLRTGQLNARNGGTIYNNQITFINISEELSTYQKALENILEMPIEVLQSMKDLNRPDAINHILTVAKRDVSGKTTAHQKSFRHQILDVSDSIIKKHISRSNDWTYKIGFCCHTCDFSWEVKHVINDLAKSLSDPCRFLDSCETTSPPCCLCPSFQLFEDEDLRKRIETTFNGTPVKAIADYNKKRES